MLLVIVSTFSYDESEVDDNILSWAGKSVTW